VFEPIICYDLCDTLGSTWLTQGLLNVDPIQCHTNSIPMSTHFKFMFNANLPHSHESLIYITLAVILTKQINLYNS